MGTSDDGTDGDLDPAEWSAEQARTVADDAAPLPADDKTPRSEHTGRHRLTSQQFASAVDLADRDGYQRGVEHGRTAAHADAEAAAVAELRRVREDAIEVIHSLWVIFEIEQPSWEEAEPWLRRRMTPL